MQGVLIVRFFATDQDAVARVADALREHIPAEPGIGVIAAIGPAAEHILEALETAPRTPATGGGRRRRGRQRHRDDVRSDRAAAGGVRARR